MHRQWMRLQQDSQEVQHVLPNTLHMGKKVQGDGYVTGKDEAKIIASDGVLLGTNAEITQSFELQRQLNPRIKKPVGHIALSFKPEDKPRLTDEFMAKIAIEYMQMMGITDTQFIIVRHHNTDNPHCHIVYNRINNEGKLISDRNDYRRNEQVTKALKSKYGLTYGTDKSKTSTRKLRNAERAKYEIHNAVKGALNNSDSWQKFKSELAKRGVHLEFVYMDKEQTKVQGIRFCNDGMPKAVWGIRYWNLIYMNTMIMTK